MKLIQLAKILAVGTAFSASAQAAPTYRITDIGILSGYNSSQAYGLNDLGQVVGTVKYGNDPSQAFIWSETSGMQLLGNLGWASTALSINNRGQVVGTSYKVPYDTISHRAFIWTADSGMQEQSIRNAIGEATAINNNGQVTGGSGVPNNSSQFYGVEQAYVLNPNPDPLQSPQIPTAIINDYTSVGNDINDNGQIVGWSIYGSSAFAWDPANGLRTLQNIGTGDANAYSVNNNGIAVGFVSASHLGEGAVHQAAIWNLADGSLNILASLPGGWGFEARSINDSGIVVGSGDTPQVTNAPTLWENGVAYSIYNLIDQQDPLSSTFFNFTPAQINNLGQIVGTASFKGPGNTSFVRGVLLTPTTVPVPSALWLFGSVVFGWVGLHRRKQA